MWHVEGVSDTDDSFNRLPRLSHPRVCIFRPVHVSYGYRLPTGPRTIHVPMRHESRADNDVPRIRYHLTRPLKWWEIRRESQTLEVSATHVEHVMEAVRGTRKPLFLNTWQCSKKETSLAGDNQQGRLILYKKGTGPRSIRGVCICFAILLYLQRARMRRVTC